MRKSVFKSSGLSAPTMFAFGKKRLSHDVSHMSGIDDKALHIFLSDHGKV